MKTFIFETDTWIPATIDEVFNFFSDARNLDTLTPPLLKFKILTPDPIVMQVGTLIDYKLKIRGIPVTWQSEITVWENPHKFIDEQRKGPYRSWVHEHQFVEDSEGTYVKDIVKYSVWGGSLINKLLISRDLNKIFNYRKEALSRVFGS